MAGLWGKLAAARACVVVLLLAACGGGGGEDGDAFDLRLVNVRATGTTQRVYASTQRLGNVTITADVTGTLSRLNGRTLYVIVTDPDGLFEATPSVFLSSDGIGNSISLTGKSTLERPPGTYRGPLTIRVCLDTACAQQFEGSPAVVPLQVDVLAGLQVPPPLVVDLAFGQTPTAIDVPVTVPVDAAGFSFSLSTLPANPGGALTLDAVTPAGLRILPRPLPVGSYTQTFTFEALAVVNAQGYPLVATLPVTINVSATPGLVAKIDPPQVALEALSSGAVITQQFGPNVSVLAADGQLFSEVSRVQYLAAGAGGVLDAGGIPWLGVTLAPGPYFWYSLFQPQASACTFVPTTRCLSPGRYAANVYFRVPGGAELPVPLPVTLDVR